MKITDSLYVLPIGTTLAGNPMILGHRLILDEQNGPALVDAGGPVEALEAALGEAGVKLADLRHLILTHQDLDHPGSAAAIVGASNAKVLAPAADAPHINGTHKWLKTPPPQALEQFPPQIRAVIEKGAEPVTIDQLLQGAEILDLAGGVGVIFTPGHTPGHISLYLEKDKVLIAADAITAEDGQVRPPSAGGTLSQFSDFCRPGRQQNIR
ncbi:MAG: MBL fold metallo-hydrolase [Thermaceae bacterium]|nr:MBL fold metallo-hydrolase [Thermaceae bacterium]